ncbi:MAG: ABC transporter substrate-binding protein [Agathobacter sp.]|uniref:ABC transporter substrate-binding protein n=1 Tax=Agathobacter sp. TaxID=2021311 RepID=UPI00257F2743|nr:ABC transporter substrate-binding protein [Agathobacter sp.]MBQ1681372.1 ABC transporter substrate-binding protein [Agathobacter sp.]
MKKKLLSMIMAAVMISTFVAGCGKNTTSDKDTSAVSTEASQTVETQALPTQDRAGNDIVLPSEVNAIVSMAPSITRTLIDLGLSDKIVACDTNSAASYGTELTADIPQFDMMTPDQEQIIALKADLVLTSGMSAAHGDDVFASVKESGVCVCDFPSSASLAEIQEDIKFIGTITGLSDKANAIVEQMQASMDELAKIAATIPEEEKKTVLFELFTPSADTPTIYTCGANTYITEMIGLIGATNVAEKEADQWPALTEEAAVAMNPDVILTADMYTPDVINVLLKMSGWENVTAIKNSAVYQLNSDEVNQPNHHVISAMIAMAKAIYPDYYKDVVDPFSTDKAEEKEAA